MKDSIGLLPVMKDNRAAGSVMKDSTVGARGIITYDNTCRNSIIIIIITCI